MNQPAEMYDLDDQSGLSHDLLGSSPIDHGINALSFVMSEYMTPRNDTTISDIWGHSNERAETAYHGMVHAYRALMGHLCRVRWLRL